MKRKEDSSKQNLREARTAYINERRKNTPARIKAEKRKTYVPANNVKTKRGKSLFSKIPPEKF